MKHWLVQDIIKPVFTIDVKKYLFCAFLMCVCVCGGRNLKITDSRLYFLIYSIVIIWNKLEYEIIICNWWNKWF